MWLSWWFFFFFFEFARCNAHYLSTYIYIQANTNNFAGPLCRVSIHVAEGKLDAVIPISCLLVLGKIVKRDENLV